MRRLITLAVTAALAAAVTPAAAGAAVTVTDQAGQVNRQWTRLLARYAPVTPAVTITVRRDAASVCGTGAYGCVSDQHPGVVFLNADAIRARQEQQAAVEPGYPVHLGVIEHERYTFLHEAGHIIDRAGVLNGAERARLAQLAQWPTDAPWSVSGHSADDPRYRQLGSERFADLFASCAADWGRLGSDRTARFDTGMSGMVPWAACRTAQRAVRS